MADFLSSFRSRADDARDAAERYRRDARDSAERYGRRASSSLRDVGESLRGAGDTLRDRGDDARSELSKLWNDLEDLVGRRVTPAAQDAAHYASRYARDGRDAALDMASQLRDVTRSRPLVAIGVAIAATWVISTMLRSKR